MRTFRDAGDTSDFVHVPLEYPASGIRLVHIKPSNVNDDEIECTITTHDLSDRLPFAAISYTWGDMARMREITLNGKRTSIGENGWLVLWQADCTRSRFLYGSMCFASTKETTSRRATRWAACLPSSGPRSSPALAWGLKRTTASFWRSRCASTLITSNICGQDPETLHSGLPLALLVDPLPRLECTGASTVLAARRTARLAKASKTLATICTSTFAPTSTTGAYASDASDDSPRDGTSLKTIRKQAS